MYLLAAQVLARLIEFSTKGHSTFKKVLVIFDEFDELEKLKDQDDVEFKELL
ncbi:MAG: hypothetical protein Q8853_02495 [Candidatus Phytoplasma australasiaticum]|nr:hypothetical protein [Candidatus Phytoplasma australasiaticum]